MTSYLFELPTTGAISFADFCIDTSKSYTVDLAEATQARANLRAALKDIKRTDGEKDNLKLVKVLDDYLPQLCSVIACVSNDELVLRSTPIFSWRTTLSVHFLSSSRLSIPGLPADLAFSLLTYAFALCNLARASTAALGSYEHDRSLSEKERQAKDEKLNFAVTLLCKASGIFGHIADAVIGEWEAAVAGSSAQRPPELTREVALALAKMALADAQTLAIRKLLTKAAAETAMHPGPPLPKSHPAPALIAKLHLEAAALYTSARALAKTPSAAKSKPKLSIKSSKDHDGEDGNAMGEVNSELRRYLADQGALHAALAHKWLGVDAGEGKGDERAGEAVGWLAWARKELEELKDGNVKVMAGEREKEMRGSKKEAVFGEVQAVDVFLRHYKKMNDSLSFQPVPSQAELQSLIPTGRLAVTTRPYTRPAPAFGPGSMEYVRRRVEELDVAAAGLCQDDALTQDGASNVTSPQSTASYAGAGAYF